MNQGNPGPSPDLAARTVWVGAAQGALVAFTVLDLLWPRPWLVGAFMSAAVLFIGMLWRGAPVGLRRTCTLLMLVTTLLLTLVPDAVGTLVKGLRIGGLIGSLLLSIATLSRAAQRVGPLRRLMGAVLKVPPGRRFSTVTVTSQFFGGFLGLAGITMMMEAASQAEFDSQQERAACFGAIARGYAAANLWSPMFSNLSILLAVNAGLAWTRVFPAAVGLAAISLVLTLSLQKLKAWRSPAAPGSGASVGWWALLRVGWMVLAAMLAFLVCVLAISHGSQQPVAGVVIVLAPLAAWLLALCAEGERVDAGEAARRVLRDFAGFRSMVGEVMLFFASGCAGTVIASALPSSWTQPVATALLPFPVLGCLFLAAGVVLLSCTSVHPMLSGIVLAVAFPAASLGLNPVAHVLAVLAGLGVAVILTPFSVISLMASRLSGLPLFNVSVRANFGFALLNLLLVALILGHASSYLLR